MITSTTPALRLPLHRAGLGQVWTQGRVSIQTVGLPTSLAVRLLLVRPETLVRSPQGTYYSHLTQHHTQPCRRGWMPAGRSKIRPWQSQPSTAGGFDVFAQIPPSRGRLGRHTDTTMIVPLDQLWSPSPPYPLSGGVGPRFPQGTPLT